MAKEVTIEIKRGSDGRAHIIYASVYSAEGLEVSADLDYCLFAIQKRGWHLTNPTAIMAVVDA